MAGYNASKADTFNKLIEQGLSQEAAAAQAGITDADFGDYALGDNGILGPVIAGTGTQTPAPTAAALAESEAVAADFEQVEYAQTAQSTPGRIQSAPLAASGDEAISAFEQAQLAQQEGSAFAQPEIPAAGDEALQAYEDALLAQTEGQASATQPRELNDPLYGLSSQQLQALGGADPTDPYIRARLGIPQLPGSPLAATPGFGTIKTGVPIIDNALNFLSGLFGRPATPPTPAAAPVNPAVNGTAPSAAERLSQDQQTAADAAALSATQDNANLRNINEANAEIEANQAAIANAQDIIDSNNLELSDPTITDEREEALLQNNAAQEDFIDQAQDNIFENELVIEQNAEAFSAGGGDADSGQAPEVSAASDAELQAIEDAQAGFAEQPTAAPALLSDAELAAIYPQTDPGEVGALRGTTIITDNARALLSDPAEIQRALANQAPELQPVTPDSTLVPISEDEAAALLEEAENTPPPETEAPPVDAGSDAELQAIEDAQAADLAAQEGSAFAEPVDAGSDAELQAIEDAQAADLAAQEGSAFAPPVDAGSDAELQAIEDAQAAQLADQESSAFAEPVDAGSDAELQAIEDAQAADLAAQEGSAFAPPVDAGSDAELQAIEDAQAADLAAQEGSAFAPQPVPAADDAALAASEKAQAEQQDGSVVNPDAEELAAEAAARQKAKEQAVLQARYKQPSTPDWRVRLVLAEGSTYLYNAPQAGILAPLARSNGVVFPYTPQISTSYQAQYDTYDLIHSNFRGVFYKNSKVNDVSIRCTFTAQDSSEAAYMLAVIHFFRSVTKMFYGQDTERGTPPPLVYLVGYGDYQFAGHPCLVSTFNYTLPNDVDYIRANAFNNYGSNLLGRREAPLSSPSPSAGQRARQAILGSVGINPGAVPRQLTPPTVNQNVYNTERATYVPTKMEIDISLIPVNTRNQISKEFSFKEFANGNLVKKGYW